MNNFQSLKHKSVLLNFIIINYNGEKYIVNLLDSIQNQTYQNYDIIIIDNNSTDNSISIIKNHFLYKNKRIKLCSLNKNIGFAYGNNIGIKNSSAKYIALINNDVLLHKNWAEEMICLAEKNSNTGIITSKVLFAKNNNIINSAGVNVDERAMPYNKGMYEYDKNQFNNIEETEAFYGAAGFIKREVIENTGYFNKYYFMYQEEYDLSVRTKKNGWKILYNPKAIAYHYHSASSGKYSPKKTFYSIRNYVWNTYKYLSIVELLTAHKNFFKKLFQSKDSANETVVLPVKKKIKILIVIIYAYAVGTVCGIINYIIRK